MSFVQYFESENFNEMTKEIVEKLFYSNIFFKEQNCNVNINQGLI